MYSSAETLIEVKGYESRIGHIREQAILWHLERPEEYDDVSTPISTQRVCISLNLIRLILGHMRADMGMKFLIEHWSRVIYSAHASVGYLATKETLLSCNKRVMRVCIFLLSRTRRHPFLESMFMYAPTLHASTPMESLLKHYDQYLRTLDEAQDMVRIGFVHYHKAAIYMRKLGDRNAANLYLDKASTLLSQGGHRCGVADCRALRIEFNITMAHNRKERIDQLRELSDEFVALGHPVQWWRWVSTAISWMENPSDVWSDFAAYKDAIGRALEQLNNRQGLLELEVLTLRHWIFRPSQPEKVRYQAGNYLENPPKGLLPGLKYHLYRQLIRACGSLFDREKACDYAQQFFEIVDEQNFPTVKSEALCLLIRQRNSLFSHKLSQGHCALTHQERDQIHSQYEEEITQLSNWAKQDSDRDFVSLHNDKVSLVVSMLAILKDHFPDRTVHWENSTKAFIQESLGQQVSHGTYFHLSDFLRLQRQGNYHEMVRLASDSLKTVMENKTMSITAQAEAYHICASAYNSLILNVEMSRTEVRNYRDLQLDCIRHAVKLDDQSGNEHTIIVRVVPFADAIMAAILAHPNQNESLNAEAGAFFRKVDNELEAYRRRIPLSFGVDHFLKKRNVVSTNMISNIYAIIVQFYIRQKKLVQAWQWMQKSKGRALLDIMAWRELSEDQLSTSLARRDLVDRVISEEASRQQPTPQINQGSQSSSTASHIDDSITNVGQSLVSDIYKTLRTNILVNVADFRLFDSVADLLFGESRAFLLDWLIPSHNLQFVELLPLILSCRTRLLDSFSSGDVFLRQVHEWINEYLVFRRGDLKRLENKKSALKGLRPLMTGVDEITNAGDLLILTPSAPLSMVPLHGLSVDGQPLVERNLVLYCSSLTLFKHCILRSRQCETTEDRSLKAAVFTAVFEEPGGEVEKERILSSVAQLAEHFDAMKILGEELTVAKFRNVLESAPWIHYHGHAHYERSSGLEQSFVLNDETAAEMVAKTPETDRPPQAVSERITDNENSVQRTQDLLIPAELDEKRLMLSSRPGDRLTFSTRLNAAEIFSMRLCGRPFVCCIACDSSAQDVYGGNEPFGLVSALFCAGASSVLGTLWPIESETGRMFTKYFYANVREQLAEAEVRGRNTIDLATALSDSVRELRKWRSDPYSWAAFVLHGSPLYRFR